MPQKLSPKAAKAKAKKRSCQLQKRLIEDKKKAENQRKRRKAAKKHGVNWLLDKDYDHTKKRFVKVAQNRGNYGKGTKPKS